jgi:hypothetical protein
MFAIPIPLLTLVCLSLSLSLVLYIKKFKKELSLFTDSKLHEYFLANPIYGLNTKGILPIPNHLADQDAVVMIVDPLCKTCHNEIEKFIQSEDKHIPFVCLVSNADITEHDEFIRKFSGEINAVTIKSSVLHNLKIDYSPVIFIVNKHGLIVRVQSPLDKLLHYYKKYISEGAI